VAFLRWIATGLARPEQERPAMQDTSIGTAATLRPPVMPKPSGSGMQVEELVRTYIDSYNANDLEAMLACCNDDVVFETITNPGGSIRLNGKDEMREVLIATTLAFRERRHQLVGIIVEGDRAAAETVFSGIAAAELGSQIRLGEHVSIRGATIFERHGERLGRICEYS
jgi:ketosteroid isomerase-like protein